jgi:recombination protein RecT
MAKKTVARRHSKVLPMSTDLDDLIRRDDELYDMAGASDKATPIRRPQLSDFSEIETSSPTDTKTGPGAKSAEVEAAHDQETGEVIEEIMFEPSPADAYELGKAARDAKKPRRAPPEIDNQGEAFSNAWIGGWDDADAELQKAKK